MSLFPADPLPLLHRPPRPLPLWAARWPGWAQTALLPFSMLALLALPNNQAAVVGGHQPDAVQREDGQAVSEGLAHTHLPQNAQREQRLPGKLRGGFFQSNCSKENYTSVHLWGV